ncbi:hypothetical protein B0H14DRAFT_3722619 [Mycena olivaceomarginata]|nr:hypothetical protein B0H14DRAFT_3722619 [Mycena olivaceomarginata]
MEASSTQVAALTLLPTTAFVAQVVFNLDIVNTQLGLDGFTRDTVVPNGMFPGPKVQKGDSVVIHTHNKLTSPDMRRSTSTVFFQARTSGMDGLSFENQCPIAPNTTFDYVFDTPNQTGNNTAMDCEVPLWSTVSILPHSIIRLDDDESSLFGLPNGLPPAPTGLFGLGLGFGV